LGQTAGIMRMEDQWMESESEKWFQGSSELIGLNKIIIPLPSFRKLPTAFQHRVIRHALASTAGNLRRVSLRHIQAVNRAANGARSHASLNLPNGLTVQRSYDRLIFSKGEGRAVKEFSYTLDGPGRFFFEDLESTIVLEETENIMPSVKQVSPMTAFLDADLISYPMTVRSFRPGDSFIPFGMSGHKKLKNFFIDLKIPVSDRGLIPILTNDDKPIWVCGLRIDDRYKVTSETRRVLKVTFSDFKPWPESL
jgi:tRNA(Ile)-lysidine synthase